MFPGIVYFDVHVALICDVVVILLLNVMEVFSVGVGACDPIVHLSVSSIGFCMLEVISSSRSLRLESWVTGVCSRHVISLHTM